MRHYVPPHPGEFITGTYLEPFGLSAREVAEHLQVSPSTFSRVVAGTSAVSADMAIRLSRVLGRSPESWLQMQKNYEIWVALQTDAHEDLQPLELNAV